MPTRSTGRHYPSSRSSAFHRCLRIPAVAAWSVAASLCALPSLAQGPAAPTPGPAVELGESTVTVRTATTGGRIVLLGFLQEEAHHVTRLVRREEILEDTDGDGVLTFDLQHSIPFASAWVAVDFLTGEAEAAVPEGLPLWELKLPERAIPVTLDGVDLQLPVAEILVVRPGVGVWGLRVGDGGVSDRDSLSDGTLRATLAAMWSVSDSPAPPQRLAAGDVVVVIDPLQLRLAIVRLTA